MNPEAENLIRLLQLAPHPEGGYFRETWRSSESLAGSALPERFGGERSLGTAILYLLPAGKHSCLRRLQGDEIWHLYEGGPLHLDLINPAGEHQRLTLGREADRGETFQCVVPNGCWFGAEPAEGAPYALAGCTVTPGFTFEDFEMADRDTLLAAYPRHRALVERLTPPKGTRQCPSD
jgi:predicted cupin superfamily sugar epimerase